MNFKAELQQAHDELARMGWPTVAELIAIEERAAVKRAKRYTERRRDAEQAREMKQWNA